MPVNGATLLSCEAINWYNLATFMSNKEALVLPVPIPEIVYAREPFSDGAPYAAVVNLDSFGRMLSQEFGLERQEGANAVIVLDFKRVVDQGPSIVRVGTPKDELKDFTQRYDSSAVSKRNYLVSWERADASFEQRVKRELVGDLLTVGGAAVMKRKLDKIKAALSSFQRIRSWVARGTVVLFLAPSVEVIAGLQNQTLNAAETYAGIAGVLGWVVYGVVAYRILGERMSKLEKLKDHVLPTVDRLSRWSDVVEIVPNPQLYG